MLLGYARVSTQDQNLIMQLDALQNAGCEKIYKEKVSAVKKHRQELEKLLLQVREGDTIVVWKLDRLGRSLRELINIVSELQERSIGFMSLNDQINTTTAQGRFTFNIFASLAEFEREMIRERTKEGLIAARARGRFGGRPKGLSKKAETKALLAKQLFKSKKEIPEILEILEISKSTFYRYIL